MLVRQERLLPVGHPNYPGDDIEKLELIIVHNTGNEALSATDEANIKYMGRKFTVRGGRFFEADGETEFRYGSANVFVDQDSATVGIPLGKKTYNAGDRQLPYNNGYKGQTAMAKSYKHKQNSLSWSYEMCQNGRWDLVVKNTIETIVHDLIEHKVDINTIKIVRHYDLSGKKCPARFVANEAEWAAFKKAIYDLYKEKSGTPKPSIPAKKPQVRATTALNFRKDATQKSVKIMAGQIPRGAVMDIVGPEKNSYIQVKYNNLTGYVHAAYVQKL